MSWRVCNVWTAASFADCCAQRRTHRPEASHRRPLCASSQLSLWRSSNQWSLAYGAFGLPFVDQRNPMIASDAGGWTWMARVRPSPLPIGPPATTGSAATQRLESGRILWTAADAAATRHRRQLDYCKSNGWAGLFSYWRCGIGRRPVVVTWYLKGCDVGHEGGASFGGCLAVCR